MACAGLAGLTIGQLLSDRLVDRSPQSATAVSAARLASAMALAGRIAGVLPRGRSSPRSEAVIAFAAGVVTVAAAPLLGRLLQGRPPAVRGAGPAGRPG